MIDILWILISASLVFLMQPGFMCLESGLTRPKNSINVAVKNLTDFVFSVMAFWTVGYGLMFGLSLGGLFGTDRFFVNSEESAHLAAFFLFQAMFCGTATTIFSGAVAERMRFSAYIIIVLLTSVFIYPLFGHWAWNGLERGTSAGWLGARGFVDFAGSTVVHSVGIFSAFCLAFLLTYWLLKQIDGHYPLRVSEKDEELGLNISEHGARTDLLDLLEAMDRQARQADLSIRVPVQPFTETGHIAQRYNQVMGALENAMEDLKASESKYRAFFENTGTANVIVEENEIISLINSKFEALSGYSKSQIEGRVAISDLFSEREKGRVAEYHRLRRIDRQKAPRSYETELVDRTGAAKPVYVSVSMVPGTKSESILRDADIAMYRAKYLGKARYQVFTKEMYEQTLSTLKIETDLRKAIANNQLKLYYQPIFSPCSRRLLGFEALIRWFHPERGLIMPGSFIPIAEDSGLIIAVGQWVVQEACRQMATWRKRKAGIMAATSLSKV